SYARAAGLLRRRPRWFRRGDGGAFELSVGGASASGHSKTARSHSSETAFPLALDGRPRTGPSPDPPNELAAVERFGVAVRRATFEPSQARQAVEGILGEPALAALRPEMLHQPCDFGPHRGGRQRHVHARRAEAAVVLRNLVLENQVVAERVPRELPDQSMVLVKIAGVVREDHVGIAARLELLERLLDARAFVREEPVAKRERLDSMLRPVAEYARGAPQRLVPARARRREHDPVDAKARSRFDQLPHGAAGADLDVVAVSADDEHGSERSGRDVEGQAAHHASSCRWLS